jgi:hypothetical protein
MGFSIGIIGGGISGLSAAYYLRQQALASGQALELTIYERKPLLGGNADTVAVQLGELQGPDGRPVGPFVRWADLGVNDVNLATYLRLKQMMTEVGYLDHMRPLQDTTCYFTADGQQWLTDDAALYNGVTDPRFNLAAADQGALSRLIQVVHQHAIDLVTATTPVPASYTVGQYFADCIAQPEARLAPTANRMHIVIDWGDPAIPARLARIRDEIYYPRISAMYFTDNRLGPAGMPLQSPFQYYRVQEGGVTPDRRYFAYGAQHWLAHLADWMVARNTDKVQVRVHRGRPVTVAVSPAGAAITPEGEPTQAVDLVLMTLHADDALRALNWQGVPPETAEGIRQILSTVRYTRSYGMCHTDDRVLPRNRQAWRTYNVLVHPRSEQIQPYRMSYVENFHQNDPQDPAYNQIGWPMFFTSLVPDLHDVQASAVLPRLTGAAVPAELARALPHLQDDTPQAYPGTGYSHELAAGPTEHMGKAWALFKHNVLDLGCIQAQQAMARLNEENAQQPMLPIFFGGGWTLGAGLHEQCLAQSQHLVRWVQTYRERTQAR